MRDALAPELRRMLARAAVALVGGPLRGMSVAVEPTGGWIAAELAQELAAAGAHLSEAREAAQLLVLTALPDGEALRDALGRARAAAPRVVVLIENEAALYGRGPLAGPAGRRTLSFYDLRTVCEEALGPGTWRLGGEAEGAGFLPPPLARGPEGAPRHATDAGPEEGPAPSAALCWLGAWGFAPGEGATALRLTAGRFGAPGRGLVGPAIARGGRRRLALVIDRPDWAFANIADNLTPLLEGRYEVTRFVACEHPSNPDLLREVFLGNRFDNVHVMWRELMLVALREPFLLDCARRSGLSPAAVAEHLARPVLTTSIYDHLHLRAQDLEARRLDFAAVDGYAVSSSRLLEAYRSAPFGPPVCETPDGVDLPRFAPARERNARRPREGTLVVGWVGNSAWGRNHALLGPDPKGFHSILRPAVERLQAEGLDLLLHAADRTIRHRDREEMVDFYGEIDLLVCASSHEGTPNPVLEAMASGLPVLSTDVGILHEVCGPRQREFVLAERTVEAMAEALRRLAGDPGLRRSLAEENLERIAGWSWGARLPAWLALFSEAEARHAAHGARVRRVLVESRILAAAEAPGLARAPAPGSAGGGHSFVSRLRRRAVRLLDAIERRSDGTAWLSAENERLRARVEEMRRELEGPGLEAEEGGPAPRHLEEIARELHIARGRAEALGRQLADRRASLRHALLGRR